MAKPEMTIAEAFNSTIAAYFGATEPEAYKLVRTYRAFRQDQMRWRVRIAWGQDQGCAKIALASAREAVAAGKPRYPVHGKGGLGAPFKSGGDTMRWVEVPASVGLRQVDTTRGYWSGDMGEEYVGVVFQLPARKGKVQLVAGYLDPNQDGPAAVCFDITDDKGTAFSWAEHCAQRAAEEAEEENEAFRLEQETEDLTQLVADLRAERRSLIAEVRASGGLPPAICDTLRKRIYSIRRESREAHKRLAAIESGMA